MSKRGMQERRRALRPPERAPAGVRASAYAFTSRSRWLFTAFLVTATAVPYLVAWVRSPEGTTYNWILPPYREDGLAYLAWVRQAASGALLFKIKFTALPQPALILQPFFLVAGWLCRVLHTSAGFTLFLLRLTMVVLFCIALARFIRHFRFDRFETGCALLLVACSSGIGGLLPDGTIWWNGTSLRSADVWLVDINTLWSLTWNPLFPLVLALMQLVVELADRGARNSCRRDYLVLGMLAGLLALLHPYDLVLLGPLVGLIALVQQRARAVPLLLWAALAASPFIAYQAWVSLVHPLLGFHGDQGAMPTPSLTALALGLGLPGLLAFGGAAVVLTQTTHREAWPLVAWVVLALVLSQVPVWFQRKLLMGIHLPICLLAAIALSRLRAILHVDRMASLTRITLAGAALGGALITMATHVANFHRLTDLLRTERADFYIDNHLAATLEYLGRHSSPDDIVLADYATSRHIPGMSGNTVLWGHWAQSVDREARSAWLAEIFDGSSAFSGDERLAGLRESHVRFILVDQALRARFHGVPQWLRAAAPTVFRAGDVELLDLPAG